MYRRIFSGIILGVASLACGAQAPEMSYPSADRWWESFGDSTLTRLIVEAEDANYDVAMAARRIRIARQTLASARSQYFPSVSVNGSWTKGSQSGMNGKVATPRQDYDYFNAGLTMSWEIDVFGKIRSGVESKKALYRASQAEYAATMLSTAATVATTYINLRAYQNELVVARAHAQSQKKVVDIVQARYEAGIGNKLEVSQSLGVYYSTLASIPTLQTSVTSSINALAVLLSRDANEVAQMLEATADLPDPHQLVASAIPADLVRRRPDVAEAEMQIEAYASLLGAAKKDYLPSLTLQGSIGTSAHKASDLFSDKSLNYSITPTLSWTLFDGFARNHNVEIAREQTANAVDNYNLTLLTAFQEANNAVAAYQGDINEISALENVNNENEESLKLSVDLYKRGLTAFSNVVDAQVNSLSSKMTLIQAQAQALCSLVNIYKAIGGGWEISQTN